MERIREYLYPTTGDIGWIEEISKNFKSDNRKFAIPFYKFKPNTLPEDQRPFWMYLYYSDVSTSDVSLKHKILYRVRVITCRTGDSLGEYIMLKLEDINEYNYGKYEDARIWFICDDIQEVAKEDGTILIDEDFVHIDKNKKLLSCIRNSIAPVRCLSKIIRQEHPSFIKKGVFPKSMDVYGKVIKVENVEDNYRFAIDIINEDMVLYDKYIKENFNEINHKMLKPYFYFLTINTVDKSVISRLKERLNKEYYIYKLSKASANVNTRDLIVGQVLFSASPLTLETYIVQIQEALADYNDDDPLPDNAIIKNKNDLQKIYNCILCNINCPNSRNLTFQCPSNNKIEVTKVSVTHVGRGHNSEVELCNGANGFYDIGRTISVKKDRSCDGLTIDFNKYKWVILSHWDMDHYLGVTLGNSTNASALMWLAPSKIVGSNARRLAWLIYICSGKKPFLIDDSIVGKVAEKDSIQIIRGNGLSKNDSGLMLFVNQKFKFASLGDVSYRCIDRSILPFTSLDYLVVSHHGAKVDKPALFPFIANACAKAILPVGSNDPLHPSKSIRTVLKNASFKTIHETNLHGTAICKLT